MNKQSRYITVNGIRKRNPARLAIDVLTFMKKQEEGVTMRCIIFALRAGGEAVKEVLEGLAAEGKIESVDTAGTGNRKGRTDVRWHVAGRLQRRPAAHSFRGAETLLAFQTAARIAYHSGKCLL